MRSGGGDAMRKCTARAWDKTANGNKGGWIDISGSFHQFGVTSLEVRAGVLTSTTAIVEDIEGQVWEAEVASLRFTEATQP